MTVAFDYTPDQAKAWLQDHAIAILGRLLAQDPVPISPTHPTPTGEIDIWYAYYLVRGEQQTVINFYTSKPVA